ncbi:MAG: ROK family transcriptional regulator [Devosia sp.]
MTDGNAYPQDYISVLGRGMQPADVRQANQRAVLTLVMMDPGISNAGLARRTGLAPQTISAVLTDLEKSELVIRGDALRGRRGQPATPMFTNPRGAFCIGVEIGWTHIRVVLLGITSEVFAEYRRSYDYPDAESIFDELKLAVAEVSAKLSASERERLIGVGLAVPSGIGEMSALLSRPRNQASLWAQLDVAKAAAAATGLDVALVSDGNAACCSEMVVHPMPKPETAVFLLIDIFVAAAILGANRLWESTSGAAVSIGSMRVTDSKGEIRLVNELASLHALQGRLETTGLGLGALSVDPAPALLGAILDGWIEEAAPALAQALINTATIIDYDLAIIDGVLPEAIRARLVAETQRHVSCLAGTDRKSPQIAAGHLGRSTIAEGAAQLRLYKRFIFRDLQTSDS